MKELIKGLKLKLKELEEFITQNKMFLAIFLLALVLRFSGLKWGFPFIFHPDEPTLVRGGLGVRFDPNPHHFDWPTFQTYFLFVVISVWAKFTDILQSLGLRSVLEPLFPLWWDRPIVFYFWGRVISAFLGSLSLIPLFLIAKKIFNKKLALLASFIFAISLQNIEDSHFATLDSSMTFWVLMSFYFAHRMYETGLTKYYILSGFLAGISASTKYNGAFVVFSIFAYHLIYVLKNKKRLVNIFFSKGIWLSGFSAILGFLVGTPYAILDFSTFIRTDSPKGALWQFSRQSGVPFAARYLNFPLFEKRFRTYVFRSIGPFLSVLSLWGIFQLIFSKYRKKYLPLLFFGGVYLWYVGQFPKFLSQYFNPIYPFLAIFSAYGFLDVLKRIKGVKKYAFFCLISGVFVFLALSNAFRLVYVFATRETRLQARDWIHKNVPYGTKIALAGGDKIELEEYDERRNYGYKVKNLGLLLTKIGIHENEQKMRKKLRNEYKVKYVVSSGFNLEDAISKPYDPDDPYSPELWAKEVLKEVVRFKPRFYNEPLVIIYYVKG